MKMKFGLLFESRMLEQIDSAREIRSDFMSKELIFFYSRVLSGSSGNVKISLTS